MLLDWWKMLHTMNYVPFHPCWMGNPLNLFLPSLCAFLRHWTVSFQPILMMLLWEFRWISSCLLYVPFETLNCILSTHSDDAFVGIPLNLFLPFLCVFLRMRNWLYVWYLQFFSPFSWKDSNAPLLKAGSRTNHIPDCRIVPW